jgi:hypothetical protein
LKSRKSLNLNPRKKKMMISILELLSITKSQLAHR